MSKEKERRLRKCTKGSPTARRLQTWGRGRQTCARLKSADWGGCSKGLRVSARDILKKLKAFYEELPGETVSKHV